MASATLNDKELGLTADMKKAAEGQVTSSDFAEAMSALAAATPYYLSQQELNGAVQGTLLKFVAAGGKTSEIDKAFGTVVDSDCALIAPKGTLPPGIDITLNSGKQEIIKEIQDNQSLSWQQKVTARSHVENSTWIYDEDNQRFLLSGPAGIIVGPDGAAPRAVSLEKALKAAPDLEGTPYPPRRPDGCDGRGSGEEFSVTHFVIQFLFSLWS